VPDGDTSPEDGERVIGPGPGDRGDCERVAREAGELTSAEAMGHIPLNGGCHLSNAVSPASEPSCRGGLEYGLE
jgi:hypothetical protein